MPYPTQFQEIVENRILNRLQWVYDIIAIIYGINVFATYVTPTLYQYVFFEARNIGGLAFEGPALRVLAYLSLAYVLIFYLLSKYRQFQHYVVIFLSLILITGFQFYIWTYSDSILNEIIMVHNLIYFSLLLYGYSSYWMEKRQGNIESSLLGQKSDAPENLLPEKYDILFIIFYSALSLLTLYFFIIVSYYPGYIHSVYLTAENAPEDVFGRHMIQLVLINFFFAFIYLAVKKEWAATKGFIYIGTIVLMIEGYGFLSSDDRNVMLLAPSLLLIVYGWGLIFTINKYMAQKTPKIMIDES